MKKLLGSSFGLEFSAIDRIDSSNIKAYKTASSSALEFVYVRGYKLTYDSKIVVVSWIEPQNATEFLLRAAQPAIIPATKIDRLEITMQTDIHLVDCYQIDSWNPNISDIAHVYDNIVNPLLTLRNIELNRVFYLTFNISDVPATPSTVPMEPTTTQPP
eukprot:CAMPEP_0168535712 /NCGR_PEP_ID=MMETSP0405-20121227/18942_1 /TAXON_ID=498012 /ORGANISM="Trichosphaerium sp, Strain Am-I-7 wt" /LENGTH=158 /DNA_ID=CAMNT_0008563229 /DNA_START=182 /DNA_END=654 /DNA_ORIENTATION=-